MLHRIAVSNNGGVLRLLRVIALQYDEIGPRVRLQLAVHCLGGPGLFS
jgi:hypothetical protein